MSVCQRRLRVKSDISRTHPLLSFGDWDEPNMSDRYDRRKGRPRGQRWSYRAAIDGAFLHRFDGWWSDWGPRLRYFDRGLRIKSRNWTNDHWSADVDQKCDTFWAWNGCSRLTIYIQGRCPCCFWQILEAWSNVCFILICYARILLVVDSRPYLNYASLLCILRLALESWHFQ